MKIGLCGAQGTGKTTLAKAYSEATGIPYIDAKVGDFLRGVGVDLSRDDIPVIERMKAQLMVVGHIASTIEAPGLSKTGFITDRTPIDVMAHTHDIAAPHYKNDEVMELYAQTRMVCTETTIENFNLSLILRPGVPLTEEDHQRQQRGSLNPFYVSHMDMLMSSFILSFSKLPNRGMLSRFAFMKDEVIDLALRVESLAEVVNTIATDSGHSCEPIH
ncbi:AAA family ATPase [Klebsiella grimontii]|uniref:AAA family ATPase n=1 Tax=Klebsiella grimontii TaxID=2058152 RepID=UPI0012BA2381|nr:AAA family ATPase [Klebsiella grimontii]ELK6574850.1 AAA family ATPase [Klebsiella michiganensis]